MNAAAVLALISDLYQQILALQEKVKELEAKSKVGEVK
jgi:hypothetical protein